MSSFCVRTLFFAVYLWVCSTITAIAQTGPIVLQVDATEATRKIFHAHLSIPAKPGPLALSYPKWLPGEHGPTGPIVNLAGLRFTAGGKVIPWRRDSVDMHTLHCDVPPGATSVEVDLDYLSPTSKNGFADTASATAHLAILSWNTVLLYPQGKKSDEVQVSASLKLPKGWKYGTALPVEQDSSERISFRPVSLTTLVDSPVLSGEFLKSVDLGSDGSRKHDIFLAGDSAASIEMPAELRKAARQLVAEAGALFGARHYNGYKWLLTLSDHVSQFGLEHHESSDDRTSEDSLTNKDIRVWLGMLLSHEYVHSWNGKYRRPAGLATGDFSTPMKGDLLWAYEGLTNYLGDILPARSGFISAELFRDTLAATAASMEATSGRAWRPLSDTATAAQVLYSGPQEWGSWRRGVDFYPEGTLIWLEADTIIRQQTQGKRSLNDFCRAFHGGESGGPAVKPYALDDVISGLNGVAPYDWRGFLQKRVFDTNPRAPLGGIELGGWKLVYSDKQSDQFRATEDHDKVANAMYSIGLQVKDDGAIGDVVFGHPAEKAGLSPGMKVVAVNGRKFTLDVLRAAIKESKTRVDPLDLLVENSDFYKTYRVDYHGGERYPHLERDASKPDILSEIIKPLAKPVE